MAAVGVEEDLAVQAARILVTLRNRKLLRWPEWVEKEPTTPAAAAWAVIPLKWSPSSKRRRSGGRRPGWGNGLSVLKKLDSQACDGAPSGSSPSTSAAEKASVASAAAPELPKEPMEAQSPETPLDYAGSGASSSGDDAARSPSKRRASGSVCSADKGCSTPDKRARVAEGGDDADEYKAISVSLCSPFLAFSFLLGWPVVYLSVEFRGFLSFFSFFQSNESA
jgi:hypothetical protein